MKRWKFNGLYKYFFMVCLVMVFILSASSFGLADDAMVLPKGRWMVNEVLDYYPSWDKEFNDQGEAQNLAHDYNRELNAQVFPVLANPLLPVPASLGRSIVDFERNASIVNVLISHAFTDNLTMGLKIPYWNFKTKVKTALDNSAANMIKNPLGDPNNPIVPIYSVDPNYLTIPNYSNPVLEALKLSQQEIIGLLSEGLDINSDGTPEIPGYGYKRFETWSGDDMGDMELGLKYKYFENEKWRLALQAGTRLPTGRKDDPDNLVDYGFGGGNYDIILGFQNDFIGFKNVVLNGTVRYTDQLPDKETLRVPDDPDYPITGNKQSVDRNQGDILELEFSAGYKMKKGFGINATYGGFFKEKDSAQSEDGQHLLGLEAETSQTGHTLLLGLSYNNLDRFQQKLAKLPFQFSLSHWHRFAGKNLNKAQYISFKGFLFF